MIELNTSVYLASKSPRRKKLLSTLFPNIKVIEISSEENFHKNEKPHIVVKRIAREKLNEAKTEIQNGIIITADTIVVLDNKIIGKPKDEKDAKKILKMLSNNFHYVYTGFCIYNSQTKKIIIDYVKTKVTFRKLTDYEIDKYIKTKSPLDKAGAYGIQDDLGAVFVSRINGCYYNVVGLPLTKVYLSILKVL